MEHFAELFVFNDFNSILVRAAGKAAVARADDKRGPSCLPFLKNNTGR